jgi:hypothetical protein
MPLLKSDICQALDSILEVARSQLEKNIYKQCDPTYGLEEEGEKGERKKAQKKRGKYPFTNFH